MKVDGKYRYVIELTPEENEYFELVKELYSSKVKTTKGIILSALAAAVFDHPREPNVNLDHLR